MPTPTARERRTSATSRGPRAGVGAGFRCCACRSGAPTLPPPGAGPRGLADRPPDAPPARRWVDLHHGLNRGAPAATPGDGQPGKEISGRSRPAFMGLGLGSAQARARNELTPEHGVARGVREALAEVERVRHEQAQSSVRGAQERQGCARWRSQPEGPRPRAARPLARNEPAGEPK